ncbi:uncharacterized protein SPPG_01979 [Spizellomyces punctatus DAOM BR117]|uniref:Uncharacterized protein n=1 Tax=Spizellomyces punctatus (strain DAOM BR117) TaxID=645134 RepID=A0A0L0HPK5_SPIPD|nr:uncharacterized protein SPPG_01979 [Spizellomyces punctatus DAOM BR117]KND02900.1 hypothetical protein SPPG_01979 [Spizellomyces punctatus DAOM BR117]|eukprot:XP_016610939.1 hypothetical protein SPPG_01979 [Spizellomyces punctatus DAOM BR117]
MFLKSSNLSEVIEKPESPEDVGSLQSAHFLPRKSALGHQPSMVATAGSGLLQHIESKSALRKQPSAIAGAGSGMFSVTKLDARKSRVSHSLLPARIPGSSSLPPPPRNSLTSSQSGPAFASGLLPISGGADAFTTNPSAGPSQIGKSQSRQSVAEEGDTLVAIQPIAEEIPKHPPSARRSSALKVLDDGMPEQLALAVAEAETEAEQERLANLARSRAPKGTTSRRGSLAPSQRESVENSGLSSEPHSARPTSHLRAIVEPHPKKQALNLDRLYLNVTRSTEERRGPDPGTYDPWPLTWPSKEKVRSDRKASGKPEKDDWTRAPRRFPKLGKSTLGPAIYVPQHRGTRDSRPSNKASVVLRSRVGRFPRTQGGVDNANVAPGSYAVEPCHIEHGFKPWIMRIGPHLGRILSGEEHTPWGPPLKVVHDFSDDLEEVTTFSESRKRVVNDRIKREELVTAATVGTNVNANAVPPSAGDSKPAHPFSLGYLIRPVPVPPPLPPTGLPAGIPG